MSAPGQVNPWTWSPDHNDYYRAVRLPNGDWDYIFASNERSSGGTQSSQATPRNPRQGEDDEETEQPLEPYGSQRSSPNYSYSNASPATNVEDVTPAFSSLSVSGRHDSQHPETVRRDGRQGQIDEAIATSSRGGQPSQYIPQYNYQPSYGQGVPSQSFTYSSLPSVYPASASYTPQPASVSGSGKGKQPISGYGSQAGYSSTSGYTQSYNPVTAATQPINATDAQDTETIGTVSLLRGTDGPYEKLDPSFQKPKDHWKFFVPGRVFATLWWEPRGGEIPPGPNVVKYGEQAYAKVRRFIVIRAKPKEFYSKCIQISTHGGQATTKKGLNQAQHTIIYTGSVPPTKLEGEKKLRKDPIQVIAVNESEKLDPRSRANLSKTYPVEHNIKVKEVGRVTDAHLRKLQGYWKDLLNA